MREWFLPPNRRNEPLDIRVLALAALMARPVDWRALSGASTETKPAPKAQRREGGFINRPSGVPWVR